VNAGDTTLVVGLEVHAQLATRTKCFCPCTLQGPEGPNARTCPVCLGLPGALPVLSRQALALTVRTALALGCRIAASTWWDRKHYGYADLPKGYQITQHTAPVGTAGRLEIKVEGIPSAVRIRRVHLEEDTGRSVHGDDGTRLDFDRAGTPLLEVVTEPDLRSAAEVRAFLSTLRHLLRWIGASRADMERGEMRCEPNVNVVLRTADGERVSPIAEIKNLNSISAAARAVEHEAARQRAELLAGGGDGPLPRTTRGWDDTLRTSHLQRVKEEAADYRFLPEPDLPIVTRCAALAASERAAMPELPAARRERLVASRGVTPDEARDLTASRPLADWFEHAADSAGAAAAAVAGWVLGDARRYTGPEGGAPAFPAEELGGLVRAVERGRVPRDAARRIVLPALAGGASWRDVVREQRLDAASDDEILEAVEAAVAARPDLVERARAGELAVLDVLVGDVMSRTRGRAGGAHVRDLLWGIATGGAGCDPGA
jgi:aspartyl-tRNA(Asn)/glutamyl-tRNA(Gln) amidotransferase subunit B